MRNEACRLHAHRQTWGSSQLLGAHVFRDWRHLGLLQGVVRASRVLDLTPTWRDTSWLFSQCAKCKPWEELTVQHARCDQLLMSENRQHRSNGCNGSQTLNSGEAAVFTRAGVSPSLLINSTHQWCNTVRRWARRSHATAGTPSARGCSGWRDEPAGSARCRCLSWRVCCTQRVW